MWLKNLNLFIFCLNLSLVCATDMLNSLLKFSLGKPVCNMLYEWTCDNGACIARAEKCDGNINCSDRSDETIKHCDKQQNCAYNWYRCNYGACIHNSLLCDNNWDCADGSDELLQVCRPNTYTTLTTLTTTTTQRTIRCRNQKYQCANGVCINSTAVCNGFKDCANAEDELEADCASRLCGNYTFRCNYGACIPIELKCNGLRNCLDGSDETNALCNYRTTTTRTTTLSLTKRNFSMPLSTSHAQNTVCRFEALDANLVMRDARLQIINASSVALNSIVDFSCSRGYYLQGGKTVICTARGWNVPLPKCLKYCSRDAVVQGVSTRARCVYNGEQVECNDRIRPQTVAQITCAYGYQMDPTTDFPEELTCLETGEWDVQRGFCVMKCGQVVQEVTKFALGGNSVEITEAPWQVIVYSNFEEDTYKYICGGSIIGPSIIISAAHCFWDQRRGTLIDKKHFFIAAGKTFAELTKSEDQAEFRNISRIILHNDYRDLENNYAYDLAVIILNSSLPFSYSIYPLCNPRLDNAQQYVESNITGWFAGWGITEAGLTANQLQTVATNTLSFSDCQREVKFHEPTYILSNDKFCLYDAWGVRSACKGDSGSGFVLAQDVDGKQIYRLLGVISHTPIRKRDCAENGLVTVTNVQFFRELIQTSLKYSRAIDAKYVAL